jgi:hydroxymethylglutaryl-CoA synthase
MGHSATQGDFDKFNRQDAEAKRRNEQRMSAQTTPAGVSGMSLYVPRLRVRLEDWCEWTGNPWDKVRAVVGRGFRMPGPDENVYTMAASAALKLILAYDLDPRNIGFLGLGTESSQDNSAGAVIVRGMLDQALQQLGRPPLARGCEVPEFKHACLGGIYALKSAVRYVNTDGANRQAIVISADTAEYERGTSGEQTQGAGAVAMLVEAAPRLFALDLAHSGSASAYRGPDFRKPFARHLLREYAIGGRRLHDFPVFSGKYSTFAYLDETLQAMREMWRRLDTSGRDFLNNMSAIFFHRPYHLMPVQALAFLYVTALAGSKAGRAELASLCEKTEVSLDAVDAEVRSTPDLYANVLGDNREAEPYPMISAVAKTARKSPAFRELVAAKMHLGSDGAMDLGNLYTAALPAWIAAGIEEAEREDIELAGKTMVAAGYGSGDAAEAIPFRAVDGWREAARRIGFKAALADPVDLTEAQYAALHDGREASGLVPSPRPPRFVINRIGDIYEPSFQDLGVEYYDYTGA